MKTAFKSRLRTGAVINIKHIDPQNFLLDAGTLVLNRLKNILKKEFTGLKVNFSFCGEFKQPSKEEEVEYKYISTKNYTILRSSCLKSIISELNNEVLKNVSI